LSVRDVRISRPSFLSLDIKNPAARAGFAWMREAAKPPSCAAH